MKMAVKKVSSSSPTSHTKFKNFYDGCVNYDTVSNEERQIQGREVLDSIGRFAISDADPHDITELINKLFHHGSAPLFDVQFDVHSAKSSMFQVVIMPPDLLKFSFSSHFVSPEERRQHCLPEDSFKTDDIELDTATAFNTYQSCMGNISTFIEVSIKALQFFKVFGNVTEDDSQLINETRESLKDILNTLKEHLQSQITQEHIQIKYFKTVSIVELQEEIPMIEWTTLFRALFHGVVKDDTDFSYLSVQVYSMDSITEVFNSLLNSVSQRKIYNALLAIFAHDLFNDIVTTRHWNSREHYCLKVSSSLMPVVASNLYLGTFSPDIDLNLRNQTFKVFEVLRAEMEKNLETANWIDNKTLETVKEKLKLMVIELPSTFSEDFLNSSLEKCPLDSRKYIQDCVCLLRQYQTQLYQRFSLNPHSQEALWTHFLTAFSTKTIFVYNLNTFMVPLAVLSPVYDEQIPKNILMATLGNLLARGIGHNFDYTGMKFSASGRMGLILSEEASPSYEIMVEDSNMRYNYEKYHLEDGHNYKYKLDEYTMLTLNERLSDLTAADLALGLVQQETFLLPWVPFKPRKVYFLALAQKFCTKKKISETLIDLYEGTSLPAFERVNTLVSNLEPFSETFNCPKGSNMDNTVKPNPFPKLKYEEPIFTEVF